MCVCACVGVVRVWQAYLGVSACERAWLCIAMVTPRVSLSVACPGGPITRTKGHRNTILAFSCTHDTPIHSCVHAVLMAIPSCTHALADLQRKMNDLQSDATLNWYYMTNLAFFVVFEVGPSCVPVCACVRACVRVCARVFVCFVCMRVLVLVWSCSCE